MSSPDRGRATLILAHARNRPTRALRAAAGAPKPVRWLLVDEDYLRQLEWRAALGSDAELIKPGSLIADAADELRGPFLDEITELGRRYDSLAWWASRVSERNSAVRPLFLHCCHLRVAADRLPASGTVAVVSQSRALLEALAALGAERGLTVRWAARRTPGAEAIESAARYAKRVGLFLARGALNAVLAPRPPEVRTRPRALIRTWIDRGSLAPGGAFTDRYFPGLVEFLERQGFEVLTLPVLSSYVGSYRSTWRKLRTTPQRFLAPEAHYRASDYVFALREARRAARMPRGRIALGTLDVTRLFEEERRCDAYEHGTLEALLSHRLPMRLARAGLELDLVIDPYENMVFEKPFNLGFRRFMPSAYIVGYQHVALYPNLLCNFVTPGEAGFAPLPDRVVCNGEFFRDVLVAEGLPAERTVAGPALRYRHFWEIGEPAPRSRERGILVPLPLVTENAVELLHKLVAALGEIEGVQVLLKPHPMAPTSSMLRATRIPRLPPHFELVEGSMGELLRRAGAVVAIASSALYEALAAGVPVVVVGREASLDLNPLAWEPGLGAVVREPKAIRDAVLHLLDLPDEELAAYREHAAEMLRRSFNPVDDRRLGAFVEGLVELPEQALSVTGRP